VLEHGEEPSVIVVYGVELTTTEHKVGEGVKRFRRLLLLGERKLGERQRGTTLRLVVKVLGAVGGTEAPRLEELERLDGRLTHAACLRGRALGNSDRLTSHAPSNEQRGPQRVTRHWGDATKVPSDKARADMDLLVLQNLRSRREVGDRNLEGAICDLCILIVLEAGRRSPVECSDPTWKAEHRKDTSIRQALAQLPLNEARVGDRSVNERNESFPNPANKVVLL